MSQGFDPLLAQLRAVAEPTRLRIVAILARGEFSVSELVQVLGQSQPRVSRHLKLLGDCGVLESFREQHWIYYRVPADTAAGRLARELVASLDSADPQVAADAQSVAVVLEQRARRGASAAPVERKPRSNEEFVRELVKEFGGVEPDSLLYFGIAPAEVLAAIGARARRVVGMNPSRQEVQRARALLHARGLSHAVMQRGELTALPQPSASFGTVVLDGALVGEARPADALREAVRVLRADGRLLIAEDYDALESRGGAEHPLAALRQWLGEAGLECRRLKPVDVEGAHLLIAVAALDRAAVAA